MRGFGVRGRGFHTPSRNTEILILAKSFKVSKCAKIRNRHNQVSHLTQDTNGKVTNSQLDITSENPVSEAVRLYDSDLALGDSTNIEMSVCNMLRFPIK